MYVENIFQQVQYKFYVWFHHMLPLSLACRILVHGTQNYHKSNLVLMQLHCLNMYFYGIKFYHYCQWCVWFCVFAVWYFFQSLSLKWSLHFTRQVMNLVWVTFDILNKLIYNYMVGNHKFRMNDTLSLFDLLYQQRTCFFVFCLNSYNLWSLNHQSTCPSLDHHVMNGQRTSWSSPNSYAYAPWLTSGYFRAKKTSGFLRAPDVFF